MMKKLMLCLVIIGLGLVLSTSQALAIDTGILAGLDVQAQFQNWDSTVIYYPNQTGGYSPALSGMYDSYALLNVTNINDVNTGNPMWGSTSGDRITGILYGLTDTSVSFGTDGETILATGGYIELYNKPSSLLNLGAVTTPDAPVVPYAVTPADLWGATGTPEQLYLKLRFVPALEGGNTFKATITTLTPTTIAGSSAGWLEVVGGSAAEYWNTNAFSDIYEGADLAFYDGFSNQLPFLTSAAAENGWDVGSSGNAGGHVVPEPASMILMGLGLLGARLRRRKA